MEQYKVKRYPISVDKVLNHPAPYSDCCWKTELEALLVLKASPVPRTPELESALTSYPTGSHADRVVMCILTGVVEGQPLVKKLPFSSAAAPADFEQGLKGICVELLETVGGLHYKANLAHVNIHPGSITVLDHTEPWEHVNLKDFGFARELPPGSASTGWMDYNTRTVKPAGVCSAFAAPEHVYAVWLLRQGNQDDNATLINGPAADMWSLGVVMYVWLTGQFPFGDAKQSPHISSWRLGFPCRRDTLQDQQLTKTNQQHADWEAMLARGADNPMLDRVRSCSTLPDLAVDFFSKILSPCLKCRLGVEALYHPYLKATTAEMIATVERIKTISNQAREVRHIPAHDHPARPAYLCQEEQHQQAQAQVMPEQQLLSDLRGKHPGKHMGLADLLETELQAEEKALDKKVGLPTAERRNKIPASYA